jgi:hypothetical protein
MAEDALILVEVVLAAPGAIRILELRVADEAAILVAFMLGAPQASGIPKCRITDKAVTLCQAVSLADLSVSARLLVSIAGRTDVASGAGKSTDLDGDSNCRNADQGFQAHKLILPVYKP